MPYHLPFVTRIWIATYYLGKDTPPHLKKQAFFSKIFLKRFTIFADCYENLRSIIFGQQHEDIREAETEIP